MLERNHFRKEDEKPFLDFAYSLPDDKQKLLLGVLAEYEFVNMIRENEQKTVARFARERDECYSEALDLKQKLEAEENSHERTRKILEQKNRWMSNLEADITALRADRDATQAKFDGTVRALASVILERDKLQEELDQMRRKLMRIDGDPTR